jgi:hypothetical protein
MERELGSAESYAQIRKLADAAESLPTCRGGKNKAELVVLAANARIGEEIKLIPKASGRPAKIITAPGKNKDSRSATGVPGTSRSRLQKIAAIPKPELKAIATKIQESGGDATVTAVLRELKETEDKRADYEARADKGAKCGDLKALAAAGEKFAVIYADPPWEFKVYRGRASSGAPNDITTLLSR